jgi:protein-disulfide isomerase
MQKLESNSGQRNNLKKGLTMKNIPLLVGTILGTLILIVGVSFMFSENSSTVENGSVVVDPVVVAGNERNVKMVEGETESEEGESPEMITIVEFSDFQCPACKAAAPLVGLVTEAFPGKVKFVFRHFPLDSIHPNARRAAIASEAVASINSDKFWDMHDLLFENQNEWSSAKNSNELNDILVTYVEKLDIDRTQFLERIEDNSVIELVNNDSNIGTQLGVNSTPSFYVDGVKVSAPQLLSTVESLLVK